MKLERSCGAVVFTRKDHRILFIIVQEMGGAYSFPKDHMEGNETETETAQREVFEEIGLKPAFIPGFLQEDEYDLKAFLEYEEEKSAGTVKTYSHDEVWSDIGV